MPGGAAGFKKFSGCGFSVLGEKSKIKYMTKRHCPAISGKFFSMKTASCLPAALVLSGLAAWTAQAAPIPVASVHQNADGVTLKMTPGLLKLQVFSPDIIRVVYAPGDSLPKSRNCSVIAKPARARWKLDERADEVRLDTDKLEVRVNRANSLPVVILSRFAGAKTEC